MRLLDIISPEKFYTDSLFESTLINKEDVKNYLQKIINQVKHPVFAKWLESQIIKNVFNARHEYVSGAISQPQNIPDNSPPLMTQRFKENPSDFYFVDLKNIEKTDLIKKYIPVLVEWLNNIKPTASVNLNLFQAIEKSVAWKTQSQQQAKIKEGEEVLTTYNNGFKWVLLNSAECRKSESDIMGNCIGGEYFDKEVVSLRTGNNSPKINIAYNDVGTYNGKKWVIEVKGMANTPPKVKYLPYIKDLVNYNFDFNHMDEDNERELKLKPTSDKEQPFIFIGDISKPIEKVSNKLEWIQVKTGIYDEYSAKDKRIELVNNEYDLVIGLRIFDNSLKGIIVDHELYTEPDKMDYRKKLVKLIEDFTSRHLIDIEKGGNASVVLFQLSNHVYYDSAEDFMWVRPSYKKGIFVLYDKNLTALIYIELQDGIVIDIGAVSHTSNEERLIKKYKDNVIYFAMEYGWEISSDIIEEYGMKIPSDTE